MKTVYCDQVSKVMPMATGVQDAMDGIGALSEEQKKQIVDDTREKLNKLFHGPGAESVIFTQGVESALVQTLRGILKKGDHILISPMESDVVMDTLNEMAGDVEYTMIPCNEKGQLILFDSEKGEKPFETIEKLIRPNTKAIMINHASEVCGTVLEVKEIAEFARKKGILMMANAAQTAAFIPIFMNIWGIDVLTFSGGFGLLASEKVGGFLVSDRAKEALGKENLRETFEQLDMAAVAGLSKTFEFIEEKRLYTLSSTGQKRAEQFIRKVQHVTGIHILGPGYNNRVPIVSVQTDFMDEEDFVKTLKEEYGIIAVAGDHRAKQAHKTLGTWPRGAVRFSFTYFNEESDIEDITHALWQLTVKNDKDAHIQRMPKE